MGDKEILDLLEVQYLKGRLDEIMLKAIPNVTDLHGSRKLDQRADKYFEKLRKTSESAYFLYLAESENRRQSKRKNQEAMKNLLEDVTEALGHSNPELRERIENQIKKYSK